MTQWHAFAQLEPFGGFVDDLRAGIGPAVAQNLNRAEGAEPVSPYDYFPWHDPPPDPPPQTPEQISERLRAMLNSKAKNSDGNV